MTPSRARVMTALAGLAWGLAVAPHTPAGDLASDERVIFFPTIGQRAGHEWELEIHGWVYEPERRTAAVAALRETLGLKLGDLSAEERQIFEDRARLFLADNERGKRVRIQIAGREYRLDPSGANGHFTTRLRVPDGNMESAGGKVHWLDDTGLSVISDIDDTIKISDVRDQRALLRNTFCRLFQPVPGMATLYQSWAKAGAQFHYVSASPWQLYQPLSEFLRDHGFPAGTFHLKMFRWKDESFLALFDAPDTHKLSVIHLLISQLLDRQFVLVGDSGERDPEIYGTIARMHRRQIIQIFIRDVTNEPADAGRYRQAFRDLPAGLWTIFREPDTVGGRGVPGPARRAPPSATRP